MLNEIADQGAWAQAVWGLIDHINASPNDTPPGSSRFQAVQGAVLASLVGSGPVRRRYGAHPPRHADERFFILCNLAVRRSATRNQVPSRSSISKGRPGLRKCCSCLWTQKSAFSFASGKLPERAAAVISSSKRMPGN